jgi:hypothetical protein
VGREGFVERLQRHARARLDPLAPDVDGRQVRRPDDELAELRGPARQRRLRACDQDGRSECQNRRDLRGRARLHETAGMAAGIVRSVLPDAGEQVRVALDDRT